jgi:hypothetical protein
MTVPASGPGLMSTTALAASSLAEAVILQSSGLLCTLQPWLGLDLEVSVVGVDRHEEVMQEAF